MREEVTMAKECAHCGSYKPAFVDVCAKCNNDPKLAKKLKEASSGARHSLVIDEKGNVVKKILGRK
jgi:hypothetical protein